MIEPPRQPLDEVAVFDTPLSWNADPDHRLWLRARYQEMWIHMRINPDFPDVSLYSLLVAEDETRDFDDLPERWTRGQLSWPESAT